jgi:replicative DNA helicase
VVLLAQLNREIEKENRDPRLSDLRESGAIEQDADVVLFVHVDKKLDPKADHQSTHRKLILEKQREGGLGSWIMEFQGQYQNFQRFERRDNG